jgi:hypothetical protein
MVTHLLILLLIVVFLDLKVKIKSNCPGTPLACPGRPCE